jgi:hypothetical protein
MNWILIGLLAIAAYFWFFRRQENFQTNQKVSIKTSDGSFASICSNKQLCVASEANKKNFSILKFADDLIALESEGYYINSCFGDDCNDTKTSRYIKVDSFNPYAPNAKLKLVNNGSSYYIQMYDGQYWGLDENKYFVRVADKDHAVSLQFILS